MAQTDNRDSEPALSPRELAHQRIRDRKRTTTMVVDNAGVKRILEARSKRAASRRTGGSTQS
jgi:hypothetical protein